jgi:hypothetical protein
MEFRMMIIDATEPVLWLAIGIATMAALLLGRAIGVRASRISSSVRALVFAGVGLAALVPCLFFCEVVLLQTLFALETGGASACLPLVWWLLWIGPTVVVLTALLTWYRGLLVTPKYP